MPGMNIMSTRLQNGHPRVDSPMRAHHVALAELSRMACLTFAIRKSCPESHNTNAVRRGQLMMPVNPSIACSHAEKLSESRNNMGKNRNNINNILVIIYYKQ